MSKPMILKMLTALCVVCVATTMLAAEVPGQIHYQGRLVAGNDVMNGPVNMQFRLYDAATEGTELFAETQVVTAVDGVYAVYIGETEPIPLAVFRDNATIFLELEVEGQILTPRERIVAVGYAMSAGFAQEAAVAHSLAPGAPVRATGDLVTEPTPLHVGSDTNVAYLVHMNTVSQTIDTNIETRVNWQAAEYDTAGAFNLGSDQFVVPADGYYRLSAQVYLRPAVLAKFERHDQKLIKLQIRHNGDVIASTVHRTSGKGSFTIQATRERYLSEADYVEVYVRQNTAGIQYVAGGDSALSFFSGYLMSQ